jgi:hypothetical protein
MSSSSMYEIDGEFHGLASKEYRNSWWFSPIVWDLLLDKYLHEEIQTPYKYKESLMGLNGDKWQRKLNDIMNKCDNLADRIAWELSMQQVFFSKDKVIIAQGIRDFIAQNRAFHLDDNGVSYSELPHIVERFHQIAADILEIDETESPYFVFKNTSVDDEVEYWFEEYNEENDDNEKKSLKEWDTLIFDFVHIENGAIHFTDNLAYFHPKN